MNNILKIKVFKYFYLLKIKKNEIIFSIIEKKLNNIQKNKT